MKHEPRITVGQLIEQLQGYPKEMLVDFSTLDFYRLKQRSPNMLQVEFDQSVYRDEKGRVVVENHE